MPKNQSTAAQRAREAAHQGAKYTAALRETTDDHAAGAATASVNVPQDDGFGGHEFEYEQFTDLFRCSECKAYEIVARSDDGSITPCPGLAGYGGDTERVYLLVTVKPEMRDGWVTSLAWRIRQTGIGRTPKFPWRDGRLLVESAPSVVADLERQIWGIAFDVPKLGPRRHPAASIQQLSAVEGRAVIEANRAAYVAEYGEPV